MKKLLTLCALVPWLAGAQPIFPPASQAEVNAGTLRSKFVSPATLSGAGGVITLAGGSGLTTALSSATNGSTFILGVGLYTVTPSILQSNIIAGNSYTGALLANKTNITILGIPGQSIVDGSSAMGTLLSISECSGIYVRGVTFRGYTNHNYMLLPVVTGNNYAGVDIHKSEKITFDECIFERHADHGIWDYAANSSYDVLSTNQIFIQGCTFNDIGGYRTNGVNGWVIDGAAIVPTGWTIENCHIENSARGIEPYNETDGQRFHNLVIRNNTGHNIVDFFLSPAGSTNTHNALVIGNSFINDRNFSHHGTNYGASASPHRCVGYDIGGGTGWTILNNKAQGGMYIGFQMANTVSKIDGSIMSGNTAVDINRGDGLGIGFVIGDNTDTAAAASAVRGLLFSGNVVRRCASGGFLIASGRNITVEGNLAIDGSLTAPGAFSNIPFSIGYAGANNILTNISIRNNSAIALDNGYQFAYGINSSVREVSFENNTAMNYAIPYTNLYAKYVAFLGPVWRTSTNYDFASLGGLGSNFAVVVHAPGCATNYMAEVHASSAHPWIGTPQTNVLFSAMASNNAIYLKAINLSPAAVDLPSLRYNITYRQVEPSHLD